MVSHNHPQTPHNSFNLREPNKGKAVPDYQKNVFLPTINLRSILCIYACNQNVKIPLLGFFLFPVVREESTSARESSIQDDPQH